MIVFDSIVAWGGVVDELDFATKLLSWSKSGFPELGDSEGVVISETIQQVWTVYTQTCNFLKALSKLFQKDNKNRW